MPKRNNSGAWVKKAEEDYEGVLSLIRKRRPLTDIVCFHCQQCIEKYLKALMTYHRIYFPKTHNLLELLKLLLPVEPPLQGLDKALQSLNPYSVNFRYPGEEATLKEAKEAVKVMKYLRNILRERLGVKEKRR